MFTKSKQHGGNFSCQVSCDLVGSKNLVAFKERLENLLVACMLTFFLNFLTVIFLNRMNFQVFPNVHFSSSIIGKFSLIPHVHQKLYHNYYWFEK
eukprot:UN25782